jgi:cephalosporin hydroxylase
MPTPTDPKDPELIRTMGADTTLRDVARDFIVRGARYRYTYNFSWLGVAVIQHPEDLVAMQELIWRVRPDAIVETGVAHGGSLIFYASMLHLLGGNGIVIGIDVDIRSHNREKIEAHPLASRIRLVEGSSVEPSTVAEVRRLAGDRTRVIVALDSNHTHAHVLEELRLYSPLVRRDSYLVVFDTIVEHMPAAHYADRPWAPGNSPMTAVREFLRENQRFVVDEEYDDKLLVTASPGGYLRCIADPETAPDRT